MNGEQVYVFKYVLYGQLRIDDYFIRISMMSTTE